MKGHILDYSIQTNSGVITGDDGQRYNFSGPDWRSDDVPVRGMAVDFSASGELAIDVYQDVTAIVPQASLPQGNASEGGMGFGVRCLQCRSNVIPEGAINWLLFIVFLLLCLPVGIIYLIVQSGKPKACPVCGSTRFENQAG